jgi:hypothetical protein
MAQSGPSAQSARPTGTIDRVCGTSRPSKAVTRAWVRGMPLEKTLQRPTADATLGIKLFRRAGGAGNSKCDERGGTLSNPEYFSIE